MVHDRAPSQGPRGHGPGARRRSARRARGGTGGHGPPGMPPCRTTRATPSRHLRVTRATLRRTLRTFTSGSEHNQGIDAGETSKQYLHQSRSSGAVRVSPQLRVRLMKISGSPEPLPGRLDAAVARFGRCPDGQPAVEGRPGRHQAAGAAPNRARHRRLRPRQPLTAPTHSRQPRPHPRGDPPGDAPGDPRADAGAAREAAPAPYRTPLLSGARHTPGPAAAQAPAPPVPHPCRARAPLRPASAPTRRTRPPHGPAPGRAR